MTVLSLANLHKGPEGLACYYVTSHWHEECAKKRSWKTVELPSPAPFFNLGSCGRNCNVLIYFYRKSKQSKLLGHFAVVLPTQCWCTRFGELTAINNVGRTRRRARSEKKEQCWMDVSPLFLSATADFSQLPNRSKCGREKTNSLCGKTPSVNPSRNGKIC